MVFVNNQKDARYLTIIPRWRVGYEMFNSQRGAWHRVGYNHLRSNKYEWNNIFIKTPTKYREFFPTLFVKTTEFQLVFNFEQTRTVTIFGEHGIMDHIPKPIRALELHYPLTRYLK